MIQVYADRTGGRYRLYVTGHAEPLPEKDAVCAGVSALVQALAYYAMEEDECRHVRCSCRPGQVFLSCRGGLGAAFPVIVQGLARISAEYPQHVKMMKPLTTNKKRRDIIGSTREILSDAAKV